MYKLSFIIIVFFIFPASAEKFGAWEGKAGSDYRYIEQYALSKDVRSGAALDLKRQRYDLTFSRNKWQLYITTRLVPAKEPVAIRFNVDGKIFWFKGKSAFSKQSWPVGNEFLSAMQNGKLILVEETYGTSFKYIAVINSVGLKAALKWAKARNKN
jgi:hypothetical protein